ncbi:hypothetical protein [Azotosporobacter soli]|uniref:hypothetical protein n=1 Tax=Azotosporobacter soli TaxID=3055040 RepID=UPI0031FEAF35
MEKIVLAAIGLMAVYYLARLLWKQSKGDVVCNCSNDSSGCSGCKSCPSAKPDGKGQ